MRHLHLVIAGLQPGWAAHHTPALQALLARGTKRAGEFAGSPNQHLAHLFSPAGGSALALAPVRMAHDLPRTCSPGWLCADPVHLKLMRDHILLGDAHSFELGMDEAVDLVAGLNRHFAGQAEFIVAAPERWYARLAPTLCRAAPPLDALIARPVEARAEPTEAARDLARLSNEIQMLLHDHPVNLARAARDAEPINGVWFWGGGVTTTIAAPADLLLGDSPMTEAFAAAANIRHASLSCAGQALQNEAGRIMVVVDDLHAPARYGMLNDWRQCLDRHEALVFQPALAGLQRGHIGELAIDVLGEPGYGRTLSRWDAWKVWRG
jgi:hypothetical protein